MLSRTGARLLGLESGEIATPIELGDGSTAIVRVTQASIQWLGAQRSVEVFVSENWQPRSEDPVGLIGTGLLTPHLLLVDFAERTVEIETAD